MKRSLCVCAAALALVAGEAGADSYLLKLTLDLRFDPNKTPRDVTIECFLGENDLSRVKPEDLGKKEAFQHWWDRVRGIVWKTVRLNRSVGTLDVEIPYACAGQCLKRFYACRVQHARFVIDEQRSLHHVTGSVGAGPIVERAMCEGQISPNNVNPTGSPCTTACECNNVEHEGICQGGTCRSIKRDTCVSPGMTRPCINFFSKRSGGQVCAPGPYLESRWGDCD